MMLHSSKPTNPVSGDLYVDNTGDWYVFDGNRWSLMGFWRKTDIPVPELHYPPSNEDMQKYPALKTAWEEYLTIRKLVGV